MSARLVGVDATRGVALLGMMAVHSLYESDAAGNPTWSFAIFGGRAAATFAVLAGVGIAFMTGRARVRRPKALGTIAALAARSLAIGAIGLALGYTDAALGAVILPYYAVLFLLAIPLVFLPTWLVGVVGVIVAAGASAAQHVLQPMLPVPTLLNPTVDDLLHHPLDLLSELLITGEYPALPWVAYVCAGLVIGRLTLAKVSVAAGLLTTGTVLAVGSAIAAWWLQYPIGGLSQVWIAQPASNLTVPETIEMLNLGGDGTVPTSTWWWLAVNAPHTSTPLDLTGTIGTATAALGLMLLLTHITTPVLRRVVWAVQTPLAAAGSMTLTLYTAHIMFLNSDYDNYDAGTGYTLQVIAALLIGLGWRATAGRGPLESLVTAVANLARRKVSRWPAARVAAAPGATS